MAGSVAKNRRHRGTIDDFRAAQRCRLSVPPAPDARRGGWLARAASKRRRKLWDIDGADHQPAPGAIPHPATERKSLRFKPNRFEFPGTGTAIFSPANRRCCWLTAHELAAP